MISVTKHGTRVVLVVGPIHTELSQAQTEQLITELLSCTPHYKHTLRGIWEARTRTSYRVVQYYALNDAGDVRISAYVAQVLTGNTVEYGTPMFSSLEGALRELSAVWTDKLLTVDDVLLIDDQVSKAQAEREQVLFEAQAYAAERGWTIKELVRRMKKGEEL